MLKQNLNAESSIQISFSYKDKKSISVTSLLINWAINNIFISVWLV